MERKDQRFEMLMTRRESVALKLLAENDGVSKAEYVRIAIRRLAKRNNVWRSGT